MKTTPVHESGCILAKKREETERAASAVARTARGALLDGYPRHKRKTLYGKPRKRSRRCRRGPLPDRR